VSSAARGVIYCRSNIQVGCADAFSRGFSQANSVIASGVQVSIMTLNDFVALLEDDKPDVGLPPLLQALWYEARGDWERAHKITQKENGTEACWVHAYLHRKEGDLGNAGYWYARAKRDVSSDSLDHEWRVIVSALLAQDDAN
jgi:hypothetical protein